MRILFIAQGDSPHTQRTLANTKARFPEATFDIFRSTPFDYTPTLRSMAVCHETGSIMPADPDFYWVQILLRPVTPYSANPALLAEILRRERYDFIHVLSLQEGAYLLRKALEEPDTTLKGAKVIYSLWGSDLYYFRRIGPHSEDIQKALKLCDRLHADNERDAQLARELGYDKQILPSISAITSADFLQSFVQQHVPPFKPASQRHRVMVRGSRAVFGRGFLAIRAYQKLPLALKKKFQLAIVMPAPIDLAAAYSLTDCAPILAAGHLPFESMMQLLSESRALVSLNTTDGTPQLYWEAAETHCYPIFSCDTGLGPHVRQHNGAPTLALVDPNDIREIAEAMERALTNDALVDAAGPNNHAILHQVQSKEKMDHLFFETYR